MTCWRQLLHLRCQSFVLLLQTGKHAAEQTKIAVTTWFTEQCPCVRKANNNTNVHLSCTHQCLKVALMIHINLKMIFCTHVDHSPTQTIYIKLYTERKRKKTRTTHTHTHTHTHTDCSKNWVLILVGMKILWEKGGFKRWQGCAVSKVLWEWLPNVGSKARKLNNK